RTTRPRRRRYWRGSKKRAGGTPPRQPARRRRYERQRPIRIGDGPFLVLGEDQDGGGDDRGPQSALVADRGLGDVGGADDLVGDAINLFLLVPGTVRVELHVQGGGQHLSGQLFGVIAGRIFGL